VLQPVLGAVEQTPFWQVCPAWQSPFVVHVHCMPVCVAVHTAVLLEPHWLFDVHATQASFTQTSPA
jgi:hypothetical protein